MSSQENLRKLLYDRFGYEEAWIRAVAACQEGENPGSNIAPWKRALEFDLFYAGSYRDSAKDVSYLLKDTDLGAHGDRIVGCAQLFKESGNPAYCRVRSCPICQWRRSTKWISRAFDTIPKIVESYPKSKWGFLTLTVKNCSVLELRARIDQMNNSFGRLMSRKAVLSSVEGYIKTVDVTRSFDRSAHPHIHVLLLLSPSFTGGKKYISTKKWSKLWQESLRVDYEPSVHFRLVKSISLSDTISKAIGILKYQTKNQDIVFDQEWFIEFCKQIHKTRAISTGGLLKDWFNRSHENSLFSYNDKQDNSIGSKMTDLTSFSEVVASKDQTQPNLIFSTDRKLKRIKFKRC